MLWNRLEQIETAENVRYDSVFLLTAQATTTSSLRARRRTGLFWFWWQWTIVVLLCKLQKALKKFNVNVFMGNFLSSTKSFLPKRKKCLRTSKLIFRGQTFDRLGRKFPTTIISNILTQFPFSAGVAQGENVIPQSWTQIPNYSLVATKLHNAASMSLKCTVRFCPRKARVSAALRAVISYHLESHNIHSLSWSMSVIGVL